MSIIGVLVIGLIMIVLITLIVVNAFTLSSANLKSVNNMQLRDEALAAAGQAVQNLNVMLGWPEAEGLE